VKQRWKRFYSEDMAAAMVSNSEEMAVRAAISSLKLPTGVKLKKIQFGLDYTGDPAVWVDFSVSTSVPLTKRRAKELNALMDDVAKRILEMRLPSWPHVRFIEAS
jgi:hypothetical protein